ncbi:MAG TPA: LysM peptidoglycan-binding domain-containing protein [Thermoanaerobacterales bacterium]|nr:LysM peptidoglycan-binding domain-containing protein [Thermoanaerobacterales bacterium]
MIRYLVRSGDTLSAIAERFNTTVKAIMEANNLKDPDIIFAGQVLLIPVEIPGAPPAAPCPPSPPPPAPPAPRRPTVTRTFDGVEYTMSLNRAVYKMGEPVTIRLRKKNILSVPLTLTYRTTQKVDFRVTRDGNLIWQWSRDQFFAQVVTSDTLQPGEEKVYRVVWDQKTDDMLVRPGNYTITGWNLATPGIRLSLEFTITA